MCKISIEELYSCTVIKQCTLFIFDVMTNTNIIYLKIYINITNKSYVNTTYKIQYLLSNTITACDYYFIQAIN